MQFSQKVTTDIFQRLTLGKINNFIISNDSINALTFSSSPDENKILGIVNPNEVLELRDLQWQSMYECKEYEIIEIYVRATIAGSQTNYRIWYW